MSLHLNGMLEELIHDLVIGVAIFALPLAWRKISDQEIDREYVKLAVQFAGTGVAAMLFAHAIHIFTGF
jgi:hypothetical protein